MKERISKLEATKSRNYSSKKKQVDLRNEEIM